MTKKARTILIAVLALAALIIGLFIYRCVSVGESYRLQLEHGYSRSLGDLTEYLRDMENALQKARYVATPTGQSSVAATLRQAGGGAKAAVSSLPFSNDNGAQIEKSISVIEDFALYIGRKSAEGEALSKEDYDAFKTLSKHVKTIGDAFEDIRKKAADGILSLGETQRFLSRAMNLPSLPGFDEGLSDVSKDLSSLPTMLYDGPFSDHVEKRESVYLKDKKEIGEQEAIKKAAEFLKAEESELKIKYETQGALAAYEIEGPDHVIRITKKGGEPVFYKKDLDVQDAKLTYEEALERALKILEESGYKNMKESYYVINDNTCTINFAASDSDVVFYPDLIKVTIELNEGGMVEFNATGYLMNHKERQNLIPQIAEDTAADSLSENLEIKKIATAIVPSPGGAERLCYEFTCKATDENLDIIVYINGSTGLEESIFIITKSDGGQLVS